MYRTAGVETASQVASGENLEVAEITTAPTLPLFIELPKLQALRNGHSEISADALHAPDPLEQDDDVMYNYLLGAGVIATIVLSFIAIFLAYNVTRGVRQQVHQGRRQSYPYNTSIHYRNQRAVVQLHSFREARRNSPVHYKVPSSRQSDSNQPAIKAKYYKVYLPQKDASLAGAGSQRLTATSSHFVQIHPPAPLHLEKPHQDTRSKATKVAPSTLHCQQHGKPVQSLSKDSNRADVITQTADFSKNFSETTSSQLFHWNSSNTPTSKQAMVTIV
ncbi:uncharacterized protein [Ptychodera flava]|uniref:uncharacterized protein isoform X2 n=1 Tax=Ptychodera flava TaxID=63121 RepID=UPI00396A312B